MNKFDITKKSYYLVGLGVIKSAKSAKWMNKNLFGINIPDSIIQRLEDSTNESKEGIKICIELIEMGLLLTRNLNWTLNLEYLLVIHY